MDKRGGGGCAEWREQAGWGARPPQHCRLAPRPLYTRPIIAWWASRGRSARCWLPAQSGLSLAVRQQECPPRRPAGCALSQAFVFRRFFFFPPPPPPSSPPPLFLSQGVTNLIERQHRMVALGPLFCDITWGAGGTTADLTLEIAARMQRDVGVETMMHLTCTNMPVEQLDDALDKVCERWSDEMNADKTRER